MKGFFRFFMVFYVIFRIIECSDNERKNAKDAEWEETAERYKKSQEARRNTVQEDCVRTPRSGVSRRGNDSEGDSLEWMYDRNNMDYNQYNNPDDDDAWHDYYND